MFYPQKVRKHDFSISESILFILFSSFPTLLLALLLFQVENGFQKDSFDFYYRRIGPTMLYE